MMMSTYDKNSWWLDHMTSWILLTLFWLTVLLLETAFHWTAFPLFFYVNMRERDIFDCCTRISHLVQRLTWQHITALLFHWQVWALQSDLLQRPVLSKNMALIKVSTLKDVMLLGFFFPMQKCSVWKSSKIAYWVCSISNS